MKTQIKLTAGLVAVLLLLLIAPSFGQGVSTDQPFAPFVNAMIRYAQYMPYAALANQSQVAKAGDPLYGTTILNSHLKWNAATQVQQLIYVWYNASGLVIPDNFATVLAINVGPDVPWNWSTDKWDSVLHPAAAKPMAKAAGSR